MWECVVYFESYMFPNTDTKIEQEFDKLDSYTVHVSCQFDTTRTQGTTSPAVE